MKKLRVSLDQYMHKLNHNWQQLTLRKQRQYTLYCFVAYLAMSLGVVGKVIYDTEASNKILKIKHIEIPKLLKNERPEQLQDSSSTILIPKFYEK